MFDQLGTLRLNNEDGESYTMLTVFEASPGMCDKYVQESVDREFPVWRCQHAHDCCGHFYPSTPR